MNKHWLGDLVINIFGHSVVYFIKLCVFIVIIGVTYIMNKDFYSRILSILTYSACICFDSFLLTKSIPDNSRNLKIKLIIHTGIVIIGTFILFIILIASASLPYFTTSRYANWCSIGVNLFTIYVTITPLLEAIVNCDKENKNNVERVG